MSIAERYDAYEIRNEGTYQDAWVHADGENGDLLPPTKEAIGQARRLIDEHNDVYDADENVVTIALGDNAPRLGAACLEHGADIAYVAEHDTLSRFRLDPYLRVALEAATRTDAYKTYDLPRYFLFPGTPNGRLFGASLAARLDTGIIPDAETLTIDDLTLTHPFKTGGHSAPFERALVATRHGPGRQRITMACLDNEARDFHPQCAILRPGWGTMPAPDTQRVHQGRILQIPITMQASDQRVMIDGTARRDLGPDLSRARRLVVLGRGIEEAPSEGVRLGASLADALDAQLAFTRGVLSAGYAFDEDVVDRVTAASHVGETGWTVRPEVYVALGVHGAKRHVVGMLESGYVVAVNRDGEAPIREVSDVFVEGDVFEAVPRLVKALEGVSS